MSINKLLNKFLGIGYCRHCGCKIGIEEFYCYNCIELYKNSSTLIIKLGGNTHITKGKHHETRKNLSMSSM